jgi:cell division protein FtsW
VNNFSQPLEEKAAFVGGRVTTAPGVESETPLQKGRGLNYIWLGLTVLLVLGGIVMVYSASSRLATERYHNSFYFAQKQAAFALFGFLALVIFRYIPYQVYQRWVYWAMGASLLTLILVLIPGIGSRVGGASRWFRLGGVSFQPAEFSKLVLVIFLAYSMTKKQAVMKTLSQGYLFHVGVVLIFMALVLAEPDLGMAISILLLTGVLLFVGGVRLKHLLLSLVPLIPLAYFLVWRVPYRRLRVLSYLNPWRDPLGSGFHLIHSFYAFGAGGLTGQGLGESHQKLFYLPEPHTDFIFSILGEELGFFGVVIVAALFLFFMIRCLLLALRKKDLFGIYLTVGITVIIGLQAFINMLVVMGLLPTKGLTLPFLSYGGTSLLLNLICMGILMNISAQSREEGA